MMRSVIQRLAGAVFLSLASDIAVIAHHSSAMYEPTKTTVVTGVVTQFRWINPHSVLWVTADAADGKAPVQWPIELTSPGNLTRAGWTRQMVRPNDRVEVTTRPLRDGTPGGICMSVKLLATSETIDCRLGEAIRAGEKPNLK